MPTDIGYQTSKVVQPLGFTTRHCGYVALADLDLSRQGDQEGMREHSSNDQTDVGQARRWVQAKGEILQTKLVIRRASPT